MKLHLERYIAQKFFAQFSEMQNWEEQLKLASRVEIPVEVLTVPHLNMLLSCYHNSPTKTALIIALLQLAKETVEEIGDLEQLLVSLIRYLINNSERGWLVRMSNSDSLLPYVLSRIDLTPAGQDDQARILVELKANSRGKMTTTQIFFTEKDLGTTSISAILARKGYLKETKEILLLIDESTENYLNWRANNGSQFSGLGIGIYAEDPTSNHRNTDRSLKSQIILSNSGSPARLVNDESIIQERELTLNQSNNILRPILRRIERNSPFNRELEENIETLNEQIDGHLFSQIPVQSFMLLYHLDLHHHLWVHVDCLKPYEYHKELKEKLVLPTEHLELIDILTAEMELLLEDIVEGKSGGTTVLCSGPPGVGKTLTAEVYAEIIRRPLYRVHSGQLGLSVPEMEKNLQQVLIRAQRWGAVMLIDEADVYIKRRDDNLTMNAVVGVFLRVLEYFNGLLFLTTNRLEDIDEAIISRCIAMIRYQSPNESERKRIWQVMSDQFALNLDKQLVGQLSETFDQFSGRDIKGLTKLVGRFCQHRNLTPNLELFRHCSKFRGV